MGEARDELTPTADQIEQRIEITRSRLEGRLSELEDRTRQALSIRQRVAERPWVALAGAAGVGFAIGLLRRHRHRARHDATDGRDFSI
jgi:ElaB/YqjD/DUF883 family membrane-anchored ribosome-binding protein